MCTWKNTLINWKIYSGNLIALYDKKLTHATDVKQHLELHSLKTFIYDLNFFEEYATWKKR